MARDYRIFAGAFLEGEIARRIQDVRRKYDPVTARVTPPHVTLAGTYWRAGNAVPENEAETIRRLEILPGILQPFDLILGGIHTFPGERPVVYLGVEMNSGLIEARSLLLSVLGMDKHDDYRPHLSLAMRLPWEEAWKMIGELQGSDLANQQFTAPVHELRLMQRGASDRAWRTIHRLGL